MAKDSPNGDHVTATLKWNEEDEDHQPTRNCACCARGISVLCRNGCCPKPPGAWIVLVWSAFMHVFNFYALLSVFWWPIYRTLPQSQMKQTKPEFIVLGVAQSLALLFYPLAGLLAEVVWARFKVLVAGCITMFVGLLMFLPVLAFIFKEYVCFLGKQEKSRDCIVGFVQESHQFKVFLIFLFISLFVFKLGKALFDANVIQFGVDQLQFSPTTDLSSFVHWYYWTTTFLAWLTSPSIPSYFGIQLLYVPLIQIFLVLMTPFLLCFRSHLIIEPVGRSNPLRLILRVLNFARKHNRPVYRSAFTYGELPPSRLDLGKTRYGGPFTTEEVEDVKSFWRVLAILLSLFGFTLLHNRHLAYLVTYSWSSLVLSVFGPSGTGYSSFVIVVGIPLFQLIGWPYPTDMLKRMGLGLLFGILSSAFVIFIKLYVPRDFGPADASILNNVLAVPLFMSGVAYLLVFPTALEFILAQAPRSMQGLLIGLWYAYQSQGVISDLLSIVISSKWSVYWVDLALYILSAFGLVLYMLVARSYRKRRRDEPSIVNRQVIIEEYMDRQLSYEYSNRVEFHSIVAQGNQAKKNYSTFPDIPECINT